MSSPPNTIFEQLPPTQAINDIQVRTFCEAVKTQLDTFTGNSGVNSDNKVVTVSDLPRLTVGAFNAALLQQATPAPLVKGTIGLPKSSGATVPSITDLVNNLANFILTTPLFQRLGQNLQVLTIPDGIFAKLNSIEVVNTSRYNSLVTTISAQATLITTLGVQVGAAQAAIVSEQTVRATKDYALAQVINTLWATIGTSTSIIQDGTLAAATPVAATAVKWNQVTASVNDPNTGLPYAASIYSLTSTYINSANSTMNATYIVQAQLSSGGQTVVGGFGLMATAGAGSPPGGVFDFGVRADKFFIAGTSSTPDLPTQLSLPAVPFIVVTSPQTVGGISYSPGVYMKTAFIVDASIGTAKIQDASITNAKLGAASVDTLTLAGNSVTVPSSVSNNSGLTLNTSYQSVATIVVDFGSIAPSMVYVNGMCNVLATSSSGSTTIQAYVAQDGGSLGSFGYSFTSGFSGTAIAIGATICGAGVHQYDLMVSASSGGSTYTAGQANLTVLGAKR